MKSADDLTVTEVFDVISLAAYFGAALRETLRKDPEALRSARYLVAALRQNDVIRAELVKQDHELSPC